MRAIEGQRTVSWIARSGKHSLDHDSDRLRDVIYTRGLWDAAFKYSDSVKEKELKWVVLFNNLIEQECNKYGLPIVEMTADSNEYIEKVKSLI